MSGQISLTRDQYLDSIRQVKASAVELAEKLTMTQMTWQPGGGERWSVSECLDHLAIFTEIYLDSMELAIGDAGSGAASGVFRTAGYPSARFTREAEPPPRRKIPAPAKIRPRPTLYPEGILPLFLKGMDRVSALVESTAGKDLNSVRFRNPFLPIVRFTVATGFLIIAAHVRRHLWQAEEVTRDPDFPR
jgi:hypothetical protein